jgi:lipopolysaccharide export system ATP-binding protein
MPLLDVQGLVKSYGRRTVVNGVDFQVERGEIVGLLGPNGAGKTTSFRMTCGLVDPDAGRVMLNEIDITGWPLYRRARDAHMGYLPQDSSVFRKLSVEQNLLGMMELLNIGWRERRRRCQELLEQFRITHIRKTNSTRVSGGERRRLEIARCLISNPEVVLLDEPFAGIDPVTVKEIRELIVELKRTRGLAILITDHAAEHILRIADHCYVINKGEVFFHGTAEQVRNHREVQRTYLGDDNAKPTHGSTGLHDGTHDGNEADFDDELNDEDDGVDPPGDKFYPGRGRAAGHDNAGHGNATPNAAPHSRLPGGAAPSGHSGGSVPVTTPHSRRATNANSSDRG